MHQYLDTYDDIISVENLLLAWKEFLKGKRKKPDVQKFQYQLSDNILVLHVDLKSKTYRHSQYKHFKISDPKPRDIHKASVRDRLLHHALYRKLYPFFDRTFIANSYSCRVGKGTHTAMSQFCAYAQKCARNHTHTVWVLKCDIRKFFASIDHNVLTSMLKRYIPDQDILWLLEQVISSFSSTQNIPKFCRIPEYSKGLPLGNLTSQLLVNVYMNEFDQYVKHKLKAKYYIRYADDFVILSHDKQWLERTLPYIKVFLQEELKLKLHPDKVSIKTLASGVDFLGWVHFPQHRVLRTSTKKRMFRALRCQDDILSSWTQSYRGMLGHGNTQKLRECILAQIPQNGLEMKV